MAIIRVDELGPWPCHHVSRAAATRHTPAGYSAVHAWVLEGQGGGADAAAARGGTGAWPPAHGGGGPVLHRCADPGQRRQVGPRKRRPAAAHRAHGSLRRRRHPGRRRNGEGAGAGPGGGAPGAKLDVIVLEAVGRALLLSFSMLWEVLWPLALGFLLSAIVQSVVSRQAVAGALGQFDLRGVALASGLGAASSSCSYAAVAVGRTLFRKGAHFANAIIFEFASTNLVFELGLVLFVLLGWQFVGAELAGGLLMIAILAVIFKWTLRPQMVERAREQAERGLVGRMEGHGEMDMAVTDGPFLRPLFSPRAFPAIAHYFYIDPASLWQGLLIGLLIARALGR